ncbi:unnamed protein product [Adineta steineri]|uniref:Ubiquitin thioesterase OTU n=1 Tax=Adineta steineri TaxID=433720 RepID=A0A815ID62_9BILA|nr:unnamed protein product [Adineta steineri]CAF1601325.1 unnamed protein product [Adineta steineri]
MLNSAIISASSHEFRRGQVPVDSSSLLSSIHYLNNTVVTSNNKKLRNFVAERIFKNKNLHAEILKRQANCTTAAQYREQIKKGQLHDGAIEIKVLSNLCDLFIRVVSMKENYPDSTNLPYLEYGDDAKTTKKCVYILYDEEAKHYDPLYIVNKDIEAEKLTIFERDNTETLLDLLRTFIQEKLHGVNSKESDCCISSCTTESPTQIKDFNAGEHLMDMITLKADRSSPVKRKLPNYQELTLGQDIEEQLSSDESILNDQEAKHAKIDEDEFLESLKTDSEFLTFEELFQTDFVASEFEPQIEQQSTTNSPAALSQLIKMLLEVDIAEGHRGRTRGEFIPKKSVKRNGQPSELGPPRYFSDQNGNTYLNLLMAERIFSNNLHQIYLEVVIITDEINGYAYINPYFKFMVAPNDPKVSPVLNPIYMFVDHKKELSSYSDMLRQLKLRLVVYTLTHRELMDSKQPLTIFSSPKNDNGQQAITARFNTQKTFKTAYDLHKMRFAFTLWTKQNGEKEFKRCGDTQYISSISTEDRTYTKS